MSTWTGLTPSPAIARLLESLHRDCPGWAPWLAAVEATLAECANPAWDTLARTIPVPPPPRTAPLLAGVRLDTNAAVVSGWTRRLQDVAGRSWQGSSPGEDRDAALASLAPVPFLQACQRQWGDAAKVSWARPCCPVCGGLPALVEERGDDRAREFRCGGCGEAWLSLPLNCPFCGNTDHESLVSLVALSAPAAGEEEHREAGGGLGSRPARPVVLPGDGAVEACRRCLGYIKRFTTLKPCAPEAVMLKDLASVALDLVAISNGYRRPTASAALGSAASPGGPEGPPPRRA